MKLINNFLTLIITNSKKNPNLKEVLDAIMLAENDEEIIKVLNLIDRDRKEPTMDISTRMYHVDKHFKRLALLIDAYIARVRRNKKS